MEWLVIAGLVIAVFLLRGRVGRLERRLEEFESAKPWIEHAPAPEPALPDPSIIRTMPAEAAEPEIAAEPAPIPIPDLPEFVPLWEPQVARGPAPGAGEQPVEPGFLSRRPTFDFEDVFGRRLPIWAGGIALAVAGVFLVRFSIEAGLLTPQVRVALSFLFGLLLLAGAEAAFRFEARVRDQRVRQALAGAGLATLYAGFYLAGTQYGLIGTGAAFVGLGAVTAAAIALSFRFGLPSAVLGLVGGFAAPALVASEEANVPLLTLYLALITAGLAFTGARQGRPWLGYAALAGGFLWGLALLASGPVETGDLLALGLFLTAMGAVLPMLTGAGAGWHWARLGVAGLASVQLAGLIELAGFQPLTWGLYLLLAAALAALSWREPRLREASMFAAALGLSLLLMWDTPPGSGFAPVALGFAAVFVIAPLVFLTFGRGRRLDVWQLSLASPALAQVTYAQFGHWDTAGPEPLMAAVALVLAIPTALIAWREWIGDEEISLPVLPVASTSALTLAAMLMLVPSWAAPLAGAPVALTLSLLAYRRPADALTMLAWIGAIIALAALAVTPHAIPEAARLFGGDDETAWLQAMVRWLAAALPFVSLALIERRAHPRGTAEVLAALLAYGFAAQVLPIDVLAWTAAASAALAWLALPRRRAGAAALLTVSALWALSPIAEWVAGSGAAAAGVPLLLDDVPGWREVLLRLVPLAAAASLVAWYRRENDRAALVAPTLMGVAGMVALHSAYKHLFSLSDADEVIRLALAERTTWQALLVGAGLALAWRPAAGWTRLPAVCLLALGLAHFAWFTLVLHNPLWQPQHVGVFPLANLLLPACGAAALALVMLKRQLSGYYVGLGWAADAALMVLVSFFALGQLRHAFSGSLLTDEPMTQSEDLLRSLLGIVLAIGFLAWGSRTGTRSWRVGSLVLMLLAVGKVFLVDAAGLEGLLRIASFMALGFSLIGIGWVYSRQLAGRKPATEPG